MEEPIKQEQPQVTPEAKKQKPNNKKVIGIVGVIVIAFLAFATFKIMTGGDKQRQRAGGRNDSAVTTNDAFAQQYLQNCKEREASFTSLPVPQKQFASFAPMGQVLDGHVTPTDHVYLYGKDAPETNQVIMPADGTVVVVSAMPEQYIGDRNQQTAPEDHRVVIAHNCRYVSIFIHVHKLSPALASAVGKLEPNTSKNINVELKAGQAIGAFGQSVDWTLADAQTTLAGFITPKLYEREPWKIHTIDPVSVYKGSTQQAMIAASLRTTAPYGGKIDYDKRGTVAGNWFRVGTNGYNGADQQRYWDGHLSIAPNNIDASATIVSLGNWNGKAAQFTAKQAIDPAQVTKSTGPVKYELIDMSYVDASGSPLYAKQVKGMKISQNGSVRGVVLVQVLDGEKLKVENFPGKTAAQVSGFTAAAQTYER